jgi:hypothetical protein
LGVGWLNATFPAGRRAELEEVLQDLFGMSEAGHHGMYTYSKFRRYPGGALVCWTPDEGSGLSCSGPRSVLRPESLVVLPAEALALVGSADALLALFKKLVSLECSSSRLDLSADDMGKRLLSMELIHGAAEACQVGGFRKYHPDHRYKMGECGLVKTGDTAYFGTRGGDGKGVYVRFYDKTLESEGKVDAIRFEAELSGQFSRMFFGELAAKESGAEMVAYLGRLMGGAINFRDGSGAHGHLDRMPRLSWWQAFVDRLGEARLAVERIKPSLQRAIEYLRDAWSPNVARLADNLEDQGFDAVDCIWQLVGHMVGEGRRRNHSRPRALSAAVDFAAVLPTWEVAVGGLRPG